MCEGVCERECVCGGVCEGCVCEGCVCEGVCGCVCEGCVCVRGCVCVILLVNVDLC